MGGALDPVLVDKLLAAMQREIAEVIRPALVTGDTLSGADMVHRMAGWLRIQLARRDALDAERAAVQRSVTSPAGVQSDLMSGEPLVDAAARLVTGSAGDAAERRAMFGSLVDIERDYLQRQDTEAFGDLAQNFEAGRRRAQEPSAGTREKVTAASLTAYLRKRFPDRPLIEASGVERLPGGMGKQTITFRIGNAGAIDGDVVLRMDMPFLPSGNTVIDEVPFLLAAQQTGIPVPEWLWSEPDPATFGAAFIVVRRVAGSTDTSAWIGDPEACARFGRMLARTMADIHRISAEQAGKPRDGSSAVEATRRYIAATRDFYRGRSTAPNPRIEAAFAYLLAAPLADDGLPPALVHGDIGFHNLLMQDGNVTAVIDWDYAHFGDPAEDVSYCRPFVERVLPWEDFLGEYHRHGGRRYGEAEDRYYAVWRDTRNAAACVGALGAFRSAAEGDIKSATAGLAYGPRYEIAALETILRNSA